MGNPLSMVLNCSCPRWYSAASCVPVPASHLVWPWTSQPSQDTQDTLYPGVMAVKSWNKPYILYCTEQHGRRDHYGSIDKSDNWPAV